MATAAELDAVFDKADDFLLAGQFEDADKMFSSMDVASTEDAALLLVLLTATSAAKDELPSRSKFYEEVRKKLGDKMVSGLE